jgi:hypothetical protein
MKKVLPLLAIVLSTYIANAQCDLALSNVSVEMVGAPVSLGPNKASATFNVQFDLRYNDGSKFVFIHSYLASDYPNPSFFNCGNGTPAVNPPNHNQLGTAIR